MNRPSIGVMYRGFVLGRFLLTTAHQGEGAPILDGGRSRDGEGREYGSLILLLRRWLIPIGDRPPAGLRGSYFPNPARWRMQIRRRLS